VITEGEPRVSSVEESKIISKVIILRTRSIFMKTLMDIFMEGLFVEQARKSTDTFFKHCKYMMHAHRRTHLLLF